MNQLRSLLHHPITNLCVALILVVTSLVEVWESISGEPVMFAMGTMEMKVGAYDGILAYGLLHLLRAIAELVEDVGRGVKTRP